MATDCLIQAAPGLFQLQITSTIAAFNGAFTFNAAKGYRKVPQGVRPYDPDD